MFHDWYEADLFVLVIGIYYLFECSHWLRPGHVLFLSPIGLGFCSIRGLEQNAILRNNYVGLVFGNLVPFGHALLCQQWPLSLSPDAALSYVSAASTPDERPEQVGRLLTFGAFRRVDTMHCEVLVERTLFVRACTPGLASHIAGLLRTLNESTPEQRARIIDAMLSGLWDVDSIREAYHRTRLWSSSLKVSCTLLFLYVMLGIPVLVRETLFPLVFAILVYLLLLFIVVANFVIVKRSLRGRGLWQQLATMLISPADAMHGADALFRDLLGSYHPLAIARVLSSAAAFQEFAKRMMLDLHHPLQPVCPSNDPKFLATEAWFRARFLASAEKFLSAQGLDPRDLVRPPTQEARYCQSYCPRCHGQFVISSGQCSVCRLPLERFLPSDD